MKYGLSCLYRKLFTFLYGRNIRAYFLVSLLAIFISLLSPIIGMERERSADCYIGIKAVEVEMVESAEADSGRDRLNKTGLFSAYTSRKRETDGNPFITADGTDLRKVDYCVVANNHLCFDTVIEVEQLGRCLVKDRMGRGRHNKFDVYFGTNLKLAKEFGVKRLKYKVVE